MSSKKKKISSAHHHYKALERFATQHPSHRYKVPKRSATQRSSRRRLPSMQNSWAICSVASIALSPAIIMELSVASQHRGHCIASTIATELTGILQCHGRHVTVHHHYKTHGHFTTWWPSHPTSIHLTSIHPTSVWPLSSINIHPSTSLHRHSSLSTHRILQIVCHVKTL